MALWYAGQSMTIRSLDTDDQVLLNQHIDWLCERLADILLAEPYRSLSEHELLIGLREDNPGLPWLQAREGLALFRLHFLLFHCLYHLRDQWRLDERCELQISALEICCRPWRPGTRGLQGNDPLADYYRNLDELSGMDEQGLRDLLDGFWKGVLPAGQRDQALKTLGLADPVGEPEIRRRYRQLAMKHHPDRGGDQEALQAIHQAMRQLGLR